MIAIVPVLCAIIGVLVYAFAANAKLSEIGRIAFFAGLLASMLTWSGIAIKLLP